MMVIGVADVIHVLVQHRETLADGLDRRAAVVETVRRVGLPVLLTSVTTAVGFGSLVLSDVPQVREFGLFAAVGVMVAMVLSLVSVPAILSLLPRPAPQQVTRLTEGAVSRFLQRLYGFTRTRRWLVIGVSLAAAVFGGLGLLRLEAESSSREYLPKDHPLRRQFDMVEGNLMGGVPVILHVQDHRPQAAPALRPAATPRRPAPVAPRPAMAGGDDEVIDDPEDDPHARRPPATPGKAAPKATPAPVQQRRERLRDPEVLAVLEELTQRLRKIGWVRKVISITEYLKEVNRVMHGGHPKHYRLPRDRRVIAAYLEMAGGRDREGMERLVNWEYSRANITVMCAWPNTRRIRAVLQEVQRFLARPDVKRRLGKDVTVEVTGMVPISSPPWR
jgi:predicted RND superfamily exporter protein